MHSQQSTPSYDNAHLGVDALGVAKPASGAGEKGTRGSSLGTTPFFCFLSTTSGSPVLSAIDVMLNHKKKKKKNTNRGKGQETGVFFCFVLPEDMKKRQETGVFFCVCFEGRGRKRK